MAQASCGARGLAGTGRCDMGSGMPAGAGSGATGLQVTAGADSWAWGLEAPHVASRAELEVPVAVDSAD